MFLMPYRARRYGMYLTIGSAHFNALTIAAGHTETLTTVDKTLDLPSRYQWPMFPFALKKIPSRKNA